MISLVVLTGFNLLVLLARPKAIADILELMPLPVDGRQKLLIAVVINIVCCWVYEQHGAQRVGDIVGRVIRWRRRLRRTRESEGKTYKAVEGGMR